MLLECQQEDFLRSVDPGAEGHNLGFLLSQQCPRPCRQLVFPRHSLASNDPAIIPYWKELLVDLYSVQGWQLYAVIKVLCRRDSMKDIEAGRSYGFSSPQICEQFPAGIWAFRFTLVNSPPVLLMAVFHPRSKKGCMCFYMSGTIHFSSVPRIKILAKRWADQLFGWSFPAGWIRCSNHRCSCQLGPLVPVGASFQPPVWANL